MAIEMVIPMENLADPIPIDFTFKCTNTDDIIIYVKCELVTPPAGWNGAAQQMGALGVGVDDYFLCDAYTRDRPANLTEETVDFKITYYSDAGYTLPITSETLEYEITYVDFNDVGFNIVDDDGFEVDLEGWAKTDEVGVIPLARSVAQSRTGIASMMHGWISTNIGYAYKSFAISNVTRAFIRIWMHFIRSGATTPEMMFQLITDAGGVNEREIKIAMDRSPIGGTEIFEQWICIALKMPVNGTFQVRLRSSGEVDSAGIYFDDIRVVES